MFNIYRKLLLALKKVQMVKIISPQVPTTQYKTSTQQNFQSPSPLMLFLKTLFQVYLIKKNHSLFLGLICVNESLYGYSSVV